MEHSNFTVLPKEPLPIFIGAGMHIVSYRPFLQHETVKYSRSLGSINFCITEKYKRTVHLSAHEAKHTAQYNVLSDHDDAFKDSK